MIVQKISFLELREAYET